MSAVVICRAARVPATLRRWARAAGSRMTTP